MYSTVSTEYGLWCWCTCMVPDNCRGGHLDCQVLRAPQYLNPALCNWIF